jgi:hypothetical protein
MKSCQLTENIAEIINMYTSLVTDVLYLSVNSSFAEIYDYHKSEKRFIENMKKISMELLQEQLVLEEKKIENISKNYPSNVRCLFKAYIILLTFGFSNKLLDERYYDKVNPSVFTKKCIQKYSLAEKTKSSMRDIVESTVVECLPMKYISNFFINLPVSQKEYYEATKSKIKKSFK